MLAGAGFDVRVLPGPLPTPVLAFLVRAAGAVAGMQITASHNPPADNGYKVYLGDGVADRAADRRRDRGGDRAAPRRRSVAAGDVLARSASEAGRATATRIAVVAARHRARALRVALTPMHGVGGATAVEALRRAGFTDVHVVARRRSRTPAFPTVSFPNPEEPGATDLLLALAAESDADLAIALDPDADRCALGVRDATAAGACCAATRPACCSASTSCPLWTVRRTPIRWWPRRSCRRRCSAGRRRRTAPATTRR